MPVDLSQQTRSPPAARGFRTTGLVFAGLGLLALLGPTMATVLVETLISAMLLIWGLCGVMFAYGFRAFREWRVVAGAFALMAFVGVWFLIFPGVGVTTMTALMIIGFLVEGVLSMLLGLRMSGLLPNWPWVVASGAFSFVLGLVLLFQWPMAATWLIRGLVGVNFLSTGITLLMLSRAAR